MKKLISLALVLCLLVAFVPMSTFASGVKTFPKKSGNDYEYEYNGVKFTSNVPMSESMIEDIYSQAVNVKKNKNDMINPQMIIGGNEGRITHGPVRKSYTNKTTQELANVIVAYFMTRIPVKITKRTLGNYILNKLTGWVKVNPTYIEYWNWRVWENRNCQRNYSTIARYNNKSYSKMTEVYYVDLGLHCNY